MNVLLQYSDFVQRVKAIRNEQPDPRFGGVETVGYGRTPELEDWVKQVCSAYLEAADHERQEIRDTFEDEDARSFLLCFTQRASEQVKASASVEWLLLGLTTLSIEDQRSDPRDTDLALWQFYRRAENAGIDAKPHFERVAVLSSTTPRYEGYPRSVAQQMRYPFPDLRRPAFRIEQEIERSLREKNEGVTVYWFRDADGNAVGPLSARALRECRYRGLVKANTQIRDDTAAPDAWRPAADFPEIVPRMGK